MKAKQISEKFKEEVEIAQLDDYSSQTVDFVNQLVDDLFNELRQDVINEVKSCHKCSKKYYLIHYGYCDKCKYLIDQWDISESELK